MIVSNSKRFIFIHVPKTGGTSITHVLKRYASYSVCNEYTINDKPFICDLLHKHSSASDVMTSIGSAAWNTYFKFGFVRNPWDLFVSLYFWLKIHSKRSKIRKDNISFTEFIVNFYNNIDNAVLMGGGQAVFLYNNANICLVDYIGRYENLHKDIKYIFSKLNVTHKIPHLFKTSHKNYRKYYTKRTKRIVGNVCYNDIKLFNYTF